MAARFFADENDLALGKALADLHRNVVFPGHPHLPEVPRRGLDDEWLAVIGAQRRVVITRDKRIRYKPVEKRMWVDHRVPTTTDVHKRYYDPRRVSRLQPVRQRLSPGSGAESSGNVRCRAPPRGWPG